jgi:hypothetical protein
MSCRTASWVRRTLTDRFRTFALAAVLTVGATASLAQTTPGQTDPTAPNPQAKPGATMVINPTHDE